MKKVRSELIERFVDRRMFEKLDPETEAVLSALVEILNGEEPDQALGIERKRGYAASADWADPRFCLALKVRDWKAQGKSNESIDGLANEWLYEPPSWLSEDKRNDLPKEMSEKTVRQLPHKFASEIKQFDELKAMLAVFEAGREIPPSP